MPTALDAGALLTVLLGIALLPLAETSLLGLLVIATGCYAFVLPRFIDPRQMATN